MASTSEGIGLSAKALRAFLSASASLFAVALVAKMRPVRMKRRARSDAIAVGVPWPASSMIASRSVRSATPSGLSFSADRALTSFRVLMSAARAAHHRSRSWPAWP